MFSSDSYRDNRTVILTPGLRKIKEADIASGYSSLGDDDISDFDEMQTFGLYGKPIVLQIENEKEFINFVKPFHDVAKRKRHRRSLLIHKGYRIDQIEQDSRMKDLEKQMNTMCKTLETVETLVLVNNRVKWWDQLKKEDRVWPILPEYWSKLTNLKCNSDYLTFFPLAQITTCEMVNISILNTLF